MPTRLAVVPAPDGGHYLTADGVVQSHVHPDPTVLAIPYIRDIADHLDTLRPGPLRVLHLGAGALTLARYVAATRPGSLQTAVDSDRQLPRFVMRRLPHHGLLTADTFALWTERADRAVQQLVDSRATFDVVVVDLFVGAAQVPVYVDEQILSSTGIVLTHSYTDDDGHSVNRWQPSAARAAGAGSAEGAAR